MKRLILTGGVCAALLAGGATAQTAPATLELVQLERDVRGGFVDNPPRRRESAGDVFTVRGAGATPPAGASAAPTRSSRRPAAAPRAAAAPSRWRSPAG
jgi:hypothetical protein